MGLCVCVYVYVCVCGGEVMRDSDFFYQDCCFSECAVESCSA